MGRTLLILLAGFAASVGVLAMSKNQRFANSIDRMVNQVSEYSAKNASTSGVHKALNELYLNPAWRGSYNDLAIAGGTVDINVVNDSVGGTPKAHQVKILASSANALTQVIVFDSEFQDFAVWAKDTAKYVTTQDSFGVGAPDLLIQKAPFMPKIDYNSLFDEAYSQGNLMNNDAEGHWHPGDGFPNTGGFYHDSSAVATTPNVIHVSGDMHVRAGRTAYGIYVVQGNVMLDETAKVAGVLYLPNATSQVYNWQTGASQVTGGIVTWGQVDGKGYQITVKHRPEYLRELSSNFAPNNPPIRVLTWK